MYINVQVEMYDPFFEILIPQAFGRAQDLLQISNRHQISLGEIRPKYVLGNTVNVSSFKSKQGTILAKLF